MLIILIAALEIGFATAGHTVGPRTIQESICLCGVREGAAALHESASEKGRKGIARRG